MSATHPLPSLPPSPSPKTDRKPPRAKRKLIGFKQRIEINEQRARENAGKPDGVILRRGFVVAVYALVIWAYYVFVGRLCVPMLQRKEDARGSVGQGVGLLIGFNVLWLMFIWTYSRIAFTSPGWAPQVVPKAQLPEESMFTTTNTGTPYQYIGTHPDGNLDIRRGPPDPGSTSHDDSNPLTPAQRYASEHRRSSSSFTSPSARPPPTLPPDDEDSDLEREPSTLAAPRNMLPPEIPLFTRHVSRSHDEADGYAETRGSSTTAVHQTSGAEQVVPVDEGGARAGPSPVTVAGGGDNRVSDVSNIETCDSHTPLQPIAEIPDGDARVVEDCESSGPAVQQPRRSFQQHPGATPSAEWLYERPLPPHYPGLAYCKYCKIYKPERTHHCRHCGTCVLAMDHHCPWIGQCVGWRNHKFFIIFCGWSTLFTAFVAIVLAVKMGTRGSLDGQMLALVIIGGFFTVFTSTMCLAHIAMACSALTTLESYTIRDQRDRESHLLAQKYGFFKWRTKTRTLKRWNHEYGELKTEGNRWYVGGAMREWKLLMGDDPVGWIVPIGQPKGNGMHWEQNPRFGPNGERRKRSEWPEHLR